MQTATIKNRTPSRCREWERNRRNKFNDAITRLWELVREINRANSTCKDAENVQYPKVEVVEKAIICLTDCVQEKTQLKAEILALEVKIESLKNLKATKDVSTQVYIRIRKKRKGSKYVKVKLQKSNERKALMEKSVLTTNPTVEFKADNTTPTTKGTTQSAPAKLPFLLPKTTTSDKKGPENTIVVLPSPYIFPQRPLILPTVPPTFVLLDTNMQTLNKSSFPIVNRSNNDITKTTMVNILPISAYSRPLSATKTKKANPKTKSETSKKVKKPKQVLKSKDKPSSKNDTITDSNSETSGREKSSVETNSEKSQEVKTAETSKTIIAKNNTIKENTVPSKSSQTTISTNKDSNQSKEVEVTEAIKVVSPPKSTENNVDKPELQKHIVPETEEEKNQAIKMPTVKESTEKDKENKLPNILDTALCENTVDTGNARLELAEEFLAASPTAAFLMSFPLVSGNRADSPAEETPSIQVNPKENNQRRPEITPQTLPYFEKPNTTEVKEKQPAKTNTSTTNALNKQNTHHKYTENIFVSKQDGTKTSNSVVTTNAGTENPFLNLPMSSLLSTTCALSDTTFNLDFDCNISKSLPSQSSSYVNNSNIFYKSDPFSSVKSTIYSTSNISSGHEFNSFGLYPCAMEKYATKNKTDFPNVEDNLMKIGSSRLTYDIDLGWSHKGFDFVTSTTANTFNKDTILTSTSGTYSTSYNPFNPDFHVPLVSTSNKKEHSSSKPSSSFSETISSFYSQPTNLWSEDVSFYTSNNNTTKTITSRHQNYLPIDNPQTIIKPNLPKQYEPKQISETVVDNVIKSSHTGIGQQIQSEKYTKKSPSKMHINWMTSEVRPMQASCDPTQTGLKETHKPTYAPIDHIPKKQDHNENNYFPITMHNFPSQPVQEELQVWPSARPAGTTEISIDPPPINLPTLVGDLALGPHDKKKSDLLTNRNTAQTDIQNCTNFFSVSHLMNRSTDNNVSSRYQSNNIETHKAVPTKQNIPHPSIDNNRKIMPRIESHVPQPCYGFSESKPINSYDNMNQFSQPKVKTNNKGDKNTKVQKHSYSAEALIRGGPCNQKIQDNGAKFMIPSQKFNDFNTAQDNSVAQVSHFPPLLDYSDNTYTGQQFSGTNLYNSTTNTISNSFYSNFMPSSSNLMSSNYTGGPFTGDFIDYNQTPDCNYPNHKYSELKVRNNNPTMFQQEKVPTNYKSSRRDSAAKHKLECSKKDSNKKCQSKRAKLNNEVEEWNDTSHLLWQNKTPTKRHSNLMSEELPFPNYVGNQMAGQYQPDFFNSHIMSSNMQTVGPNVDRSLASFPVTSRANFNLSTIFPEITMKVQ